MVNSEIVRIWYVSAQRLCNFHCQYCVSVEEYAKSDRHNWLEDKDEERFQRIVTWIAARPFRIGVRLATLGEPFMSQSFLGQAAWLTTRPNIEFVELLTNGSLLRKRLHQFEKEGDIERLSLWITHHHTEISVDKFVDNARFAKEEFGCFVVVNALLFPDNEDAVTELRLAAADASLHFNLDLGYDPLTPHAKYTTIDDMVPFLRTRDAVAKAVGLGANPELLRINLLAMQDLTQQSCSAGHNYFYIGIRGDVYRCSRYQALGKLRLGNVLDDDFELRLDVAPSSPCEACFGCGNKEDFLNLRVGDREESSAPSLGWMGAKGRS